MMQIKQWKDKHLAQFSYGILSECASKIVLIDPARNPQPYLDFAELHNAKIISIIETHPHADFISGHLELHQITGATIYTHSYVGVDYPHTDFDEGTTIEIGKLRFTSIHTPGHSPDSISVLLEHEGKQKAVFTGDTLFIGDCGRPDLREGAGKIHSSRRDLAKQMYHSLRKKLMGLNDDVIVYPAHGAGSLCGKNLTEAASSTIGEQKQTNWSLQDATEEEFVGNLLQDQPFIPAYFPFDVEVNRVGAKGFRESISIMNSPRIIQAGNEIIGTARWTIDVRDQKIFKKAHLPNSVNLMENGKFETWLGTIILPGEHFFLAAESGDQLVRVMERVAAIGYESQVKETLIINDAPESNEPLDLNHLKTNPDAYTIVDVRNTSEVKEGKFFEDSLSIPLSEIRQRLNEIPRSKPIVVHCAGGYRSAAASSMISSSLNREVKVFDLGEVISKFRKLQVVGY